MQRIKKGDTVEVITGKDIGERGKVITVFAKDNRVVVEGINKLKKHKKQQQAGNQRVQAQIVEFDGDIDLSNVMLICPNCNERTRVNYKVRDDGRKVRVCKKCSQDIE